MLPSGAQAGPSVSPPLIGAERVNSFSSLASGSTMLSPDGFGTSAARTRDVSAQPTHTARALMAVFSLGDAVVCLRTGIRGRGLACKKEDWWRGRGVFRPSA